MCLLCIEIQKELMEPEDFWRNYNEVALDHVDELMEVVSKTSEEYQQKLADSF